MTIPEGHLQKENAWLDLSFPEWLKRYGSDVVVSSRNSERSVELVQVRLRYGVLVEAWYEEGCQPASARPSGRAAERFASFIVQGGGCSGNA